MNGDNCEHHPHMVVYLRASRTMRTTRLTAGLVQQDPLLEEKQGESDTSEHWLWYGSSVRVRRKPAVKRRMARRWSNNVVHSGHMYPHFPRFRPSAATAADEDVVSVCFISLHPASVFACCSVQFIDSSNLLRVCVKLFLNSSSVINKFKIDCFLGFRCYHYFRIVFFSFLHEREIKVGKWSPPNTF